MKYSNELYFAAFVALLGSLAYGYQLGVLNTPLAAVASDLGFAVETHGAAVVSALLLGGIVGALAAGMAADAIGPKRAMLLNNLLLAAGCAASFWSPGGFAGLFAARVVTGLAGGALSLFVPRYVAETAPPAIRGALGSLSQLFICSGILLAYLAGIPYIDSPHPEWAGTAWWRFMLLLPVAPALLQSALLIWCPEPPVWLRWHGRHAEARGVERRLSMPESSGNTNRQSSGEALLPSDAEAHQQSAAADTSWSVLLSPSSRYANMMLLAIGVPLTQQISGINTVIYYSSDVFADAGLRSPILGAVLVGVVNILGTLAATAVTDSFGRKPLMVLSHSGMAASLFLVTLASWLPGVSAALAAQTAFVCVLVFVVFFSLGSGPLPFLYMSEILSSEIKGKVSSVAISLNWVANLAVGLTFPAMLKALGIGNAYLVYAVLNVVCGLFCALFMVETKRQPMHLIQRQLLRGA